MAIRTDVIVNWLVSPRIITVLEPSVEITIQDLVDTCRFLEEQFSNMSYPHLIDAAGKEPLGGGVLVGITATLQNAVLQFEGRPCPVATGVATESDANGVTLTAAGSPNGDFLTLGIARGMTVVNAVNGGTSTIISVESEDQLTSQPLDRCTEQPWVAGHGYVIYPSVVANISGGNLVAVDDNDLDIDPVFGAPYVNIVRTSSSSATLADLENLQAGVYAGQVVIDVVNGTSGTSFPTGTFEQPSDNLPDARAIANERGLKTLVVIDTLVVTAGDSLQGFTVKGQGATKTQIILLPGCTVGKAEIRNTYLTGTSDGSESTVRESSVDDLINANGFFFQCTFDNTLTPAPVSDLNILQCFSANAGNIHPSIDLINTTDCQVGVRAWNGGLEFFNSSSNPTVSIDMSSGSFFLGSTVTTGTYVLRGVGTFTNTSIPAIGSPTLNIFDDMLNPEANADAVWTKESTVLDGSPGSLLTYGQIVENNATNVDLLTALQTSVDAVPQEVWDVDASTVIAGSFGEIARRVAYNGVVYIDPNGTAGTTYPTGTLGQPVSNIADAVSIAVAEDIPNLWLLDDITLLASDNVNGYNIEGQNAARVSVTVTAGAKTNQSQWKNIKIDGTMDGTAIIRESILENLSNFSGIAFNCLLNPGTISIDPTPGQPVFFLSCYSGVPSSNPIIDLDNSGIHLIVRDFSGGFELQNMNGSSIACIDFNSGTIVLDSTVTAGTVIIRGVYGLTDNSTGATVSQTTNLDDIESKVDLVQLDVTDIVATTLTILKYHANRTLIDETAFTLTVFDDDKVTPLIVFDLKDETGTASITSIFERIPTGSP